MKKAKSLSAASDIIESARALNTVRGPKPWPDLISPEHRAIVMDLADRWKSGKLRDVQISDLCRSFRSATGLKVSYSTFRRAVTGVIA